MTRLTDMMAKEGITKTEKELLQDLKAYYEIAKKQGLREEDIANPINIAKYFKHKAEKLDEEREELFTGVKKIIDTGVKR